MLIKKYMKTECKDSSQTTLQENTINGLIHKINELLHIALINVTPVDTKRNCDEIQVKCLKFYGEYEKYKNTPWFIQNHYKIINYNHPKYGFLLHHAVDLMVNEIKSTGGDNYFEAVINIMEWGANVFILDHQNRSVLERLIELGDDFEMPFIMVQYAFDNCIDDLLADCVLLQLNEANNKIIQLTSFLQLYFNKLQNKKTYGVVISSTWNKEVISKFCEIAGINRKDDRYSSDEKIALSFILYISANIHCNLNKIFDSTKTVRERINCLHKHNCAILIQNTIIMYQSFVHISSFMAKQHNNFPFLHTQLKLLHLHISYLKLVTCDLSNNISTRLSLEIEQSILEFSRTNNSKKFIAERYTYSLYHILLKVRIKQKSLPKVDRYNLSYYLEEIANATFSMNGKQCVFENNILFFEPSLYKFLPLALKKCSPYLKNKIIKNFKILLKNLLCYEESVYEQLKKLSREDLLQSYPNHNNLNVAESIHNSVTKTDKINCYLEKRINQCNEITEILESMKVVIRVHHGFPKFSHSHKSPCSFIFQDDEKEKCAKNDDVFLCEKTFCTDAIEKHMEQQKFDETYEKSKPKIKKVKKNRDNVEVFNSDKTTVSLDEDKTHHYIERLESIKKHGFFPIRSHNQSQQTQILGFMTGYIPPLECMKGRIDSTEHSTVTKFVSEGIFLVSRHQNKKSKKKSGFVVFEECKRNSVESENRDSVFCKIRMSGQDVRPLGRLYTFEALKQKYQKNDPSLETCDFDKLKEIVVFEEVGRHIDKK